MYCVLDFYKHIIYYQSVAEFPYLLWFKLACSRVFILHIAFHFKLTPSETHRIDCR